jgi:predicted nucleotidyltransferase
MVQFEQLTLPEAIREDVARAVQVLQDGGCTEVYLFGSAARGTLRPDSDIDFAVRGCPPREFFFLYSKLSQTVTRRVDLVDLDQNTPLTRHLVVENELLRVG